MAIKNISRSEFGQLHPKRYPLGTVIGEEVEWWVNQAGSIIGAVAKGFSDPRWRYIVLRRVADGEFKIQQLKAEIESQPAASCQLAQAMELAESSG